MHSDLLLKDFDNLMKVTQEILYHPFPHGHSVPVCTCTNCIPRSRVHLSSLTAIFLISEYILWTNFQHVEIWWAPEKGNHPFTLLSILSLALGRSTHTTQRLFIPSTQHYLPDSRNSSLVSYRGPTSPKADPHNPHTINWPTKFWSHSLLSFLVIFWPLQNIPGLEIQFPPAICYQSHKLCYFIICLQRWTHSCVESVCLVRIDASARKTDITWCYVGPFTSHFQDGYKKEAILSDVVVHAYKPSTQETKAGDHEFWARLCYIATFCHKMPKWGPRKKAQWVRGLTV